MKTIHTLSMFMCLQRLLRCCGIYSLCFLLLAAAVFLPGNVCFADTPNASASASIPWLEPSFNYFYNVMDRFNNTFNVYTDNDEGGNHFYPSGYMESNKNYGNITVNSQWTTNCYSGISCIQVTDKSNVWSGVYWQDPENNWGSMTTGGYNLTGATTITFWAKGQNGGEVVYFFAGGITDNAYPDTFTVTPVPYTLSNTWQQYSLDLSGKNLTHVIGGFGWSSNSPVVFYLDEIKYNLARPDDLRLLLSYEAIQTGAPDKYLRNVSFTYDNALALIAFLARGNTDDLRRAKILKDTFLYAMSNDRTYKDGRLRNAYMSGDIKDSSTGYTRLPGWWDNTAGKWYEDVTNDSTSTGNIAWVMIALLSYYDKTGDNQTLAAAANLGDWIDNNTKDTRNDNKCSGGYVGYMGGYSGFDNAVTKLTWKSVEHNIDSYVAFTRLYNITGVQKWKDRAANAKAFVESMWDTSVMHYWTGTNDDGCTPNKTSIPVDIHAWSVLGLNEHSEGLQWVQNNCDLQSDNFTGFDFNQDKDGIWWEGTAHMTLAYMKTGDTTHAQQYLNQLRLAQTTAKNNNGMGTVAASHDNVTTGFDWTYYNRVHVGATAWRIFAELGYNPYWGQTSSLVHTLYPVTTTSVTPGQKLTFSFSIKNNGSTANSFYFYALIVSPSGKQTYLYASPYTLGAGATVGSNTASFTVPSSAETGTSYYMETIFDSNYNVISYKSFQFTVTGSTQRPISTEQEDWNYSLK
ncbi:MAG: hypothetical protein HQK99_17005 [Nitrospirae bacterium]|nr:hypothetical protein [Nitrospirota bacterium]